MRATGPVSVSQPDSCQMFSDSHHAQMSPLLPPGKHHQQPEECLHGGHTGQGPGDTRQFKVHSHQGRHQ